MRVGRDIAILGDDLDPYMVARGHRQIGFVGGWLDRDHRARRRFEGFSRALVRARLPRAQREGIAVPGRIAIAGFNDLEFGALTTPALTSIVSPRQQIGNMAARKLLARIQSRPAGPPGIGVGYRLEVHAST